jgi:uncharacterized membrane protein
MLTRWSDSLTFHLRELIRVSRRTRRLTMRSPVDDSSTPERRRQSTTQHRTRPDIGLTVAALTGVAVLGVIGVRALSRNPGNVGRGLRRIVEVLTNHRLSGAAADAADESEELVERTVTINRPRHELYMFWRDFGNLTLIMENIESVTEVDERRSHWVVRAPAGTTLEWDSVIVEDIQDELISWQSAPGADVTHSGRIDFRDAPGGRGTLVTATIAYEPPAGAVGKLVAKLFQREPKIQARRDLRRFKQFMETGEIATSRMNADISTVTPDAAMRQTARH